MDLRHWGWTQLHPNPRWHIYRTRSGWEQGERNSNSNCSQQSERADWLNAGQALTIKNTAALLPKGVLGQIARGNHYISQSSPCQLARNHCYISSGHNDSDRALASSSAAQRPYQKKAVPGNQRNHLQAKVAGGVRVNHPINCSIFSKKVRQSQRTQANDLLKIAAAFLEEWR